MTELGIVTRLLLHRTVQVGIYPTADSLDGGVDGQSYQLLQVQAQLVVPCNRQSTYNRFMVIQPNTIATSRSNQWSREHVGLMNTYGWIDSPRTR